MRSPELELALVGAFTLIVAGFELLRQMNVLGRVGMASRIPKVTRKRLA